MKKPAKKEKTVTFRVDINTENKITRLEKMLGIGRTDLLIQAISDLYYSQLGSDKSALESFSESGLIGCIDGDPNLSRDYKDDVQEYVVDKL